MKQLLLIATFMLAINAAFAQQTLTHNFNPAGNNSILFNMKNNNFSVQQWKERKFGVEIEIKVNQPKEVVDQLVKINRYKLSTQTADGSFKLDADNLNKAVTVGGVPLTETITIIVKTPSNYSSKGTTILKDPNVKSIAEPMDVAIRFVYADPPTSVGAPSAGSMQEGKSSTDGKNTATQDVQAKYGDIIIGGMKLDDFYD